MRCLAIGMLVVVVSATFGFDAMAAQAAHVWLYAGSGRGEAIDFSDAAKTGTRYPHGVDFLADGSTLIVDRHNHRLLRVSAAGFVTRFAGRVFESGRLNPFDATDTGLRYPSEVIAGHDGSAIICDTENNRLIRVSVSGRVGFSANPFAPRVDQIDVPSPSAVAVLPDGRYLVSDSEHHRVTRVGFDRSLEVVAGTGIAGATINGEDGNKTMLNAPAGLSVFDDGSFLIADQGNHRVLRVSSDGHVQRVIGTDHPGNRLNAKTAAGSEVNRPGGVLVTSKGTILIADSGNHRVLEVAVDSSVTPIAGTGRRGKQLMEAHPELTELDSPERIAQAPDGSILISDSGNDRVLLIAPQDELQAKLDSLVLRDRTATLRGDHATAGDIANILHNLALPTKCRLNQLNHEIWQLGVLNIAAIDIFLPAEMVELITNFCDGGPTTQVYRRYRITKAIEAGQLL